jgi:hypothetical protein
MILAILVTSLTFVESACAQTMIVKPSVPDVTVSYVDRSHYVEPIYGVDTYSGKIIRTGGGFTEENKTIEIGINSQPFTPCVYMDGDTPRSVFLTWQVRIKGHYENDWHNFRETPVWNESYKVITYGWWTNGLEINSLELGDQIDVQVQTKIGYYVCTSGDPYDLDSWVFHGETSDWSSIHILTIRGNQSTTTPTATPTLNPETVQNQPIVHTDVLFGFDWERVVLTVVAVAIAVLAVIVMLWRRTGKLMQNNSSA